MANTPNLAQSIATTGPEDNLVAVDAYGETPQGTLSSFVAGTKTTAASAKSYLDAAGVKPSDIPNIVKLKDGSIEISQKEAETRANKVQGRSILGIFGNDPKLQADAGKQVALLSGRPKATELANISGAGLTIFAGKDTTKAKGLSDAVSALLKDESLKSYVDTNAYVGTALTYLDAAIELGVPDLIDKLMQSIKDKKLAKRQLIESVYSVVARADLKSLNKILDYIGSEGVLLRVPNAIQLILAAYRYPFQTKPSEYAGLKEELESTLTRIKVNWQFVTRGSENIYDFSIFTRCSRNAITLLLLDDDDTYRVPVLCAPQYLIVDYVGQMRRNYPKMSVWR